MNIPFWTHNEKIIFEGGLSYSLDKKNLVTINNDKALTGNRKGYTDLAFESRSSAATITKLAAG